MLRKNSLKDDSPSPHLDTNLLQPIYDYEATPYNAVDSLDVTCLLSIERKLPNIIKTLKTAANEIHGIARFNERTAKQDKTGLYSLKKMISTLSASRHVE